MRNKRVFVSGGAGVIGSALVEGLLQEGAVVFVGDLKPCPKEWLGKVKYRQGDLNGLAKDELLLFNPQVFFHLAATFERSEETFSFFEENFHHNVKLSHHLLICMKDVPALEKIIFASSYLIYDPMLYQFTEAPASPATLDEKSHINPRNICGAAKLYHELELRFMNLFRSEKFSCISARIFRVYGRRSRDVISRWIRAALLREPIQVFRPEGKFDYIFADDAAEGLLKLASSSYRGIVNLGSGHARSVEEVLKILLHHFPGLKINQEDSSIPIESSESSVQLLESITGWRPSNTLEMAIPKIIAYEKERSRERSDSAPSAVLITSISKKMPLIHAVRNAANNLGQFQSIHGCDSSASAIGQYGVDHFWHCPPLSDAKIEDIISYCQSHQIKALIPTRDGELEFFAAQREELEKNGIKPMISPLESIQNCLDKKKFADILKAANLPAIPTFLSLKDLDAADLVVKERRGAGSRQLGLKLPHAQALAHSKGLVEPIFQPFVKGQEWSIDLYRSFEGKVKGCIARRRDLVVEGESQVTSTVHYPALEQLCSSIADLLNLNGHAVLQVIESEKGVFHVIECNPRFGGASTASISAGLNSFLWFFLECTGASLRDYPFMRIEGDLRQIRYAVDKVMPCSSYSI